jgi:hypothetical protein
VVQDPGFQRPLDRLAQYVRMIAQVMEPAAAGAVRLAEVDEPSTECGADTPVADRDRELA